MRYCIWRRQIAKLRILRCLNVISLAEPLVLARTYVLSSAYVLSRTLGAEPHVQGLRAQRAEPYMLSRVYEPLRLCGV